MRAALVVGVVITAAAAALAAEPMPGLRAEQPAFDGDPLEVCSDWLRGPVRSVRIEHGKERTLAEETEYDADGRLVRRVGYDGAGAVLRERVCLSTSEQRIEHAIRDADATVQATWTYARDEAGRVVEATRRDAQDAVQERWEYAYDAAGRPTQRARTGATGQAAGKTVTRYDANRWPLEISVYDADGALTVRDILSYTDRLNNVAARFVRGETGLLLEYVRITNTKTNRPEWTRYAADATPAARGVYQLDDHGNITYWHERAADGSAQHSWACTYEYDEHGNWTTMTSTGGETVQRSITYYENDDAPDDGDAGPSESAAADERPSDR